MWIYILTPQILFLIFRFVVYLWTFGFTLNPCGNKVLLKLNSHQTQAVQDLIASNTSLLLKPASHCVGDSKTERKNGIEEVIVNGSANHNGNTQQSDQQLKRTNDAKCEENHCTISPDSVRYEAECLRTDFNLRIKQVVFNSMVSAYFVGFIPVKFTQVSCQSLCSFDSAEDLVNDKMFWCQFQDGL